MVKNKFEKQLASPRQYAVIGGGMAGIACARTLVQAGHGVTVLESAQEVGGRMASLDTSFGRFDLGAQYFTVRDPRFALALQTTAGTPAIQKRWSASTVRVLDAFGQVVAAGLPARDSHWVPVPHMGSLVQHWARPLSATTMTATQVTRIERDALHPKKWQLRTRSVNAQERATDAQRVLGGFDAVLLATAHAQTVQLLENSEHVLAAAPKLHASLAHVQVSPCWTLVLAFPNAPQFGLNHLGPQWNAARSNHHRVSWVARETSKPGRTGVERWTVQASAAWSQEHRHDDLARAEAKLRKAFSEVTGIRATPGFTHVHLWQQGQTQTPLGASHVWHAPAGIGLCGDWCIGHRVEDAFVSGLTLALKAL